MQRNKCYGVLPFSTVFLLVKRHRHQRGLKCAQNPTGKDAAKPKDTVWTPQNRLFMFLFCSHLATTKFAGFRLVKQWLRPRIVGAVSRSPNNTLFPLMLLRSPLQAQLWWSLEQLLGTGTRRSFRLNAQLLAEEIRDSGGTDRASELIQDTAPRSKRATVQSRISR